MARATTSAAATAIRAGRRDGAGSFAFRVIWPLTGGTRTFGGCAATGGATIGGGTARGGGANRGDDAAGGGAASIWAISWRDAAAGGGSAGRGGAHVASAIAHSAFSASIAYTDSV